MKKSFCGMQGKPESGTARSGDLLYRKLNLFTLRRESPDDGTGFETYLDISNSTRTFRFFNGEMALKCQGSETGEGP